MGSTYSGLGEFFLLAPYNVDERAVETVLLIMLAVLVEVPILLGASHVVTPDGANAAEEAAAFKAASTPPGLILGR